jgi:hypothetical protein
MKKEDGLKLKKGSIVRAVRDINSLDVNDAINPKKRTSSYFHITKGMYYELVSDAVPSYDERAIPKKLSDVFFDIDDDCNDPNGVSFENFEQCILFSED